MKDSLEDTERLYLKSYHEEVRTKSEERQEGKDKKMTAKDDEKSLQRTEKEQQGFG
jgi:hypothetical protein